MLANIVRELNNKYITLIAQVSSDKKSYHKFLIKDGAEGTVFKRINATYGEDWAKNKVKKTYDVVIMGYKDATEDTMKVSGKMSKSKFFEKGWIGAIIFGQYVGGELKKMGRCSGMDDEVREKISADKLKYVGKVIEVEAQQRFATGSMRHPQFKKFRPDKLAKDCVYRENES